MDWKEKYIEMFGCNNPNDLNVNQALSLKIQNIPNVLYKFRSINNYSLNNLETGTVWLNTPSKYNDPFDCVQYIDFYEVYKRHFEQNKDVYIKQISSDLKIPNEIREKIKNNEDIEDIVKNIIEFYFNETEIKNQNDRDNLYNIKKDLDEMVISLNVEMQNRIKICSFCESPNNILMWSHYANQHKGFCIEYNLSLIDNKDIRKRNLHPVIYSDNLFDSTQYVLFFILNKTFNNIYQLIPYSTKYTLWKYEQEWRLMFIFHPDSKEQNYNMDCQSKVFLGLKISDEDKNKIFNICKNKNIKVFQSVQSLKKYELEFKEIS